MCALGHHFAHRLYISSMFGFNVTFFSLMFYSLCEHMFIPCLETANIHYIYEEFIIRVEEFSWNLRVGYETWLWRI